QIRVGANHSVPFENCYHILDSLNLKIIEFHDLYYSVLSDSGFIDTVNSILNTKPYLNGKVFTFYADYEGDKTFIGVVLQGFSKDEHTDWKNTLSQLNLTEDFSKPYQKTATIQVPVGEEKYWIDQIEKIPIFDYVSFED